MDVCTDQFCGREAWCSSGRWLLWQARKAQCTSREKGQDSVGICVTNLRSAWHSNAILLSANTWVVWGWRDDVDGEHWRTSVCVNNSHFPFFVISCWRKIKTGQSLSKMSKPTALHTEGTAQVSEWLNIFWYCQETILRKSNSGTAVVITTKLQTGT